MKVTKLGMLQLHGSILLVAGNTVEVCRGVKGVCTLAFSWRLLVRLVKLE